MDILRKSLNWLTKLLRLIGAISLVAMMFVTCADVLLRAFGHPIIWAVDMTGFFAVIVLACALPYTQIERGHVGVDLLALKMSPRGQAILDSITSAVSIGLFAIVAREMWLYARELSVKGEVSMTVQIPKAPFIYLISICFLFLGLVLLSDLLSNIRKAVRQ
jgi:TRAP-type C4-dicarboxylate transport system permease small subunit